jgi:hypothetical protein
MTKGIMKVEEKFNIIIPFLAQGLLKEGETLKHVIVQGRSGNNIKNNNHAWNSFPVRIIYNRNGHRRDLEKFCTIEQLLLDPDAMKAALGKKEGKRCRLESAKDHNCMACNVECHAIDGFIDHAFIEPWQFHALKAAELTLTKGLEAAVDYLYLEVVSAINTNS